MAFVDVNIPIHVFTHDKHTLDHFQTHTPIVSLPHIFSLVFSLYLVLGTGSHTHLVSLSLLPTLFRSCSHTNPFRRANLRCGIIHKRKISLLVYFPEVPCSIPPSLALSHSFTFIVMLLTHQSCLFPVKFSRVNHLLFGHLDSGKRL